jgi:hypothetical protein
MGRASLAVRWYVMTRTIILGQLVRGLGVASAR